MKDHVVCDSVRFWRFLVFNVLISASSSSIWMASVMHPSAGMFSESCFFISFLKCFVLSLGSFTVLSSLYMWAKQFAVILATSAVAMTRFGQLVVLQALE